MHPKNSSLKVQSDGTYLLPLSRGLFARIDAIDFPLVADFAWHAASRNGGYYAQGWVNGEKIYLHRLLMQPAGKLRVDHINGDPLDNRRQNLRVVTASQNSQNGSKHRDNRTGFRGIEFHRSSGLYMARITVNYERILIGYFNTAEAAALAYDERAREIHGPYARVNFPADGERQA